MVRPLRNGVRKERFKNNTPLYALALLNLLRNNSLCVVKFVTMATQSAINTSWAAVNTATECSDFANSHKSVKNIIMQFILCVEVHPRCTFLPIKTLCSA
jgi:hypothetical protein